ncbi:MAG: type II toxin-antitoxin system VapC family toxin [Oscillospiraceae bacterium]|nr:type II toxin-antitoxin system VapC family toxin [Oscillospiraceae bacterium]
MKYLLDTHTLIWLIEASPKISLEIKEIFTLSENTVFISSASLWEIAIKAGMGKIRISFEKLIADLTSTNIEILQIENEYLKRLLSLPEIHKDPFDRLLIATALVENLIIVTADENIQKYSVPWLW